MFVEDAGKLLRGLFDQGTNALDSCGTHTHPPVSFPMLALALLRAIPRPLACRAEAAKVRLTTEASLFQADHAKRRRHEVPVKSQDVTP